MGSTVTNVYMKFNYNYDRLHIDKALGNLKKIQQQQPQEQRAWGLGTLPCTKIECICVSSFQNILKIRQNTENHSILIFNMVSLYASVP